MDQRYFLLFGSQQQTFGWIRDNLKSNNGAVFLKCEQFPKYLIGIQKVQMAFDHPLLWVSVLSPHCVHWLRLDNWSDRVIVSRPEQKNSQVFQLLLFSNENVEERRSYPGLYFPQHPSERNRLIRWRSITVVLYLYIIRSSNMIILLAP